MAKRPVVNKRRRANALAARLKEELGLDVCEPLVTKEEAKRRGREQPEHQIKFYMQKGGASTAVPVNRRYFLDQQYSEDEFFNVVTRAWLHHLKTMLAYIILQGNAGVKMVEGAL